MTPRSDREAGKAAVWELLLAAAPQRALSGNSCTRHIAEVVPLLALTKNPRVRVFVARVVTNFWLTGSTYSPPYHRTIMDDKCVVDYGEDSRLENIVLN